MVGFQSPAVTPTQSPKRPILITQRQKQALIDNLQLEITERARKLRAQYVLQAQNLRMRIELRVNRIPTAMRKANMGDLYQKYLEIIKKQTSEDETQEVARRTEIATRPSPTKQKPLEPAPLPPSGTKRNSDHFSADDDKENTPDPTIPLQSKKRPKPNNHHPSTVLSPKSSNSRTLAPHQSPTRPQLGSPQKSFPPHATSPLKPSITVPIAPKPASPAKAAAVAAISAMSAPSANNAAEKPRATRTRAAAATRATKPPAATATKTKNPPITRAKRGAEPTTAAVAQSRTVSAASNSSTATTVVRKAAAAKPVVASKAKGKTVTRRVPAADKSAVEAPAQGRRVLRKRG
ncbi:MAG: hypothetical protein Q9172_006464 [Xanthocarpia lactea]